jgi:hypothetical protein
MEMVLSLVPYDRIEEPLAAINSRATGAALKARSEGVAGIRDT